MNAKDLLRAQYHFAYATTKANLSDVTAEHAIQQPEPAGNCLNWILGHLVRAHNTVMTLVDADVVWDSDQLERAASAPITSPDEAIEWAPLVDRFLASEERFFAALDALDESRLDDDGFTDPFGNDVTRGELLNLFAHHHNYLAGQLGLGRRLAGLPGAVRIPAPEPAEA